MANILKGFVGNLIDKMTSSAEIIDVRAWNSKGIYEIDVHLPMIDMNKWKCVQRLKCKVGELKYRDYTPAHWDDKTQICTLYIDAGHEGVGSKYIRDLKIGDNLIFSAAHSTPTPSQTGRVLCIADASALGNSLALKQLIDKTTYPLDTVTFFEENSQIPSSLKEQNPEFEFLFGVLEDKIKILTQWCESKDLTTYSSIYITGNSSMVREVRNILKSKPKVRAQIYANGFWK